MTHLDNAQTIESLRRERDMLRALIDSLPDGLYLKDLEGHFLIANKAACARRGVHHEAELLGKTDFENIATMTASCHNEQGIPIGILGMERLHENSTEERYRIITELISDYAYCCRFELDGSIVGEWITADSYFRTTGYAFQELANYRLYHPDDKMRSQQDVERVRQGETVESDYRIITKSGEERWVHIHRQPVWDDQQNRAVRFYGVVQDVTERKKTEQALRESEERYRIISELVSDYAFCHIVHPNLAYENEWMLDHAFTRITGYAFEEIGSTSRLYHPDTISQMEADLQRTLQGETLGNEYQIVTKSGEHRWIYLKRFPVWDDTEKRVVRYYGVAQDITERKQAEAALRRSEERYRMISELVSDYAFENTIYPDNTYKNEWILEQAFQRVTGYEFQDVYRTTRLYLPEELAKVRADIQRTLLGETVSNEYQIVTKSGEQSWIYIKRFPVWDDTENRVVRYYGVAQDITERKQAEAALRQSEERYRIVSELISDYAYSYSVTSDGQMEYEWTTDSFYRLTGYTSEEIGNTLRLYHPEDEPLVLQDIQRTIAGEITQGEYRILTKNGEVRWVHIYRMPVWDDIEKRVVRFYGVAQDITERKQAEQHERELVIQQERLQLLEELMSDLSHDLKTPITTIGTYLYLLLVQTSPEKQRQYVQKLVFEVNRLTRMVEDILTMSRLDKATALPLMPVNLPHLVDEVLLRYQPLALEKNISLTSELAATLPPILGHEIELNRVLSNLIENAIHYTLAGGAVAVHVKKQDSEMVIEISDTGIGISPEDLPHIFERFYRSDKARSTDKGGTGLGLSIVKKIVETHHGRIEVQSETGVGSCFRIFLPV